MSVLKWALAVGLLALASTQSIEGLMENQTSLYIDEMMIKKLLEAANQTKPSIETWQTIEAILSKSEFNSFQNSSQYQQPPPPAVKSKRELSNVTIEKALKRVESAIDEFPPDFMSDEVRQNGGFLIHILIFVYLSMILAIICDNYFLKSLEYISQALSLPSDIAGATFMAIGTSAPELFTSVIGVFISDNDIGTGTIVGSAVFNLIAIPGACGFAAYYNLKNMPKINPLPIIRDTIFYILTIITLILCIKDNRVDWIESITLITLYIVYIVIMYFNAQVSHIINRNRRKKRRSSSTITTSTEELIRRKSGSGKSTKMAKQDECRPLLNDGSETKRMSPPPAYQSNGPNYGSCSGPKNPLDEGIDMQAGDPLSRPLDYGRIHLAASENGKFREVNPIYGDYEKDPSYLMPYSGEFNYSQHQPDPLKCKPSSSKSCSSSENLDLESCDNVDVDTDWSDNTLIKVIMFPFTLVFFLTLPKPTRYCFVLTFISSICWIACLSYFIVWMVTLVGYTLGIPDTVSGITILAAGTSIPELISSYLIVKKAGLANMAICNSIGSNIFDILFCLGLPWLLKTFTTMVTNGFGFATLASNSIPIQSTALPLTAMTLLLTIGAMIGIFKFTKWRLCLQTGIYCLIVYIVFVATSTMLEFHV